MSIESTVFKKYSPNFEKLLKYGFKKHNKNYIKEELFYKDKFKVSLVVHNDGQVEGKVYDIENQSEFLLLKINGVQGSFIGEVKDSYENLLIKIRDFCFVKNYFVLSQSNRITNAIIQKYGNEPEFLWEKSEGTGVFRNRDTNKWYGIIMDIDKCRIIPNKKGFIEVLNVKLSPDEVSEIIKTPNVYPAYHMNRKHWITIILDDSMSDEKILSLIDISHKFTEKLVKNIKSYAK